MVKLNETVKRIIPAILFIPLFTFSIYSNKFDYGIILIIIVSIATIFSELEILTFAKSKKIERFHGITLTVTLLTNILIFIELQFKILHIDCLYIIIALLFINVLIVSIIIVIKGYTKNIIETISISLFSAIYPGILYSFIFLIKYEFGPDYVVLLSIPAWGNDAGAYFAGKFFGKRKLNIISSPNKTLEGYIGGFIASIAGCLIMTKIIAVHNFSNSIFNNVFFQILFITILVFVSIIGDLFESSMKRDIGAKDSYRWVQIEGHGGFLDVVDSVVFVLPFGYLILKLFNYINLI